MVTDTPIKLYRFEKKIVDGGTPILNYAEIYCKEFTVERETLKGYWIDIHKWNGVHGTKKWVPKEAHIPYAYPSKERALTSYLRRTRKHISILEQQLFFAKDALRQAEKLVEENKNT